MTLQRSQVVALRLHSGLSIRQIADQLGIAKLTVGRIMKAADVDGDISIHRRGRCGRKRKTTSHDDEKLSEIASKVLGKPVKSCKVI